MSEILHEPGMDYSNKEDSYLFLTILLLVHDLAVGLRQTLQYPVRWQEIDNSRLLSMLIANTNSSLFRDTFDCDPASNTKHSCCIFYLYFTFLKII
jgi:hypothetical protein